MPRSPLPWVLGGTLVLYVVGLGWGLPASDTWDNDGVAPRDFLVAVAQTFDKGSFDFAYLHLAPVHLVLLSLLTLPFWVSSVLSHASDPSALVHAIIETPRMTAIAWVARAVTVAMALGHVWALGKVGEELRGRRAGALVAATAAMNAVLVYYAHTTDLEVPYLFWTTLALLALVRAIAREEPRRLRAFAILGAFAIGTKDQAAGAFLLGAPLALGAWVTTGEWGKAHRKEILREAGIALALAVGVFLVADEVALNPVGFTARVRFLLGPASRDHAQYTRDLAGLAALLVDLALGFSSFFPVVLAPFAAAGLAVAFAAQKDRRAAGLAPLFAALSFVVTVDLTALRTEHRFVLFPMEMLGLYAGLGLEGMLASARDRGWPRAAWGAVGVVLAWGLWKAADVDVVLLFDPRYDAEAWLAANAAPGDVVETYGRNAYMLRYPYEVRATRVGPEALAGRSPLPDVTEVQGAWDGLAERGPRWVVVSEGWAWHYLEDPHPPVSFSGGRIVPAAQVAQARDAAASGYFRALLGGSLGYHVVHVSRWTSTVWPVFRIHSSTGDGVWILERG